MRVMVAPVRERGLKLSCRIADSAMSSVAPVRERGLKCCLDHHKESQEHGRPREGAWIEMPGRYTKRCSWGWRRSRKGAWIEISTALVPRKMQPVAPARERGLKYRTRLDYRFY